MNYAYFESDEGLIKLLEDYKEIFALLDDISSQILQGVASTVDDYKNYLNQSTGAYGTLEPLYSLAIAHKENSELRYYVERKRELENRGEKVVSAAIDKKQTIQLLLLGGLEIF